MAKYDSPAALEMAIKAAAAKSSAETGRAVTSFYFHRLLCRVFASENTTFVLKGGQVPYAISPCLKAFRFQNSGDSHKKSSTKKCGYKLVYLSL